MKLALPAQPNRGLIDGLAVLQALASHRDPVSTSSLADELEIEVTKVNRILKTLAYLGIAYRTSDRKYASGPGMHVLAAQSLFASGLVQRALGPLEGLSRFGLVVAMGVLWRDRVAYLYFWQPGVSTGEALGRAALYPATNSGIGMALLAERSEAEVREIYRRRTIDGFAGVRELVDELAATRERGYALVNWAGAGARTSLGVRFGTPAYAGIAFSGKIASARIVEYVSALREAVAAIEGVEEGSHAALA